MNDEWEWLIALFLLSFLLMPQIYIIYWFGLYQLLKKIVSLFTKEEKNG